MVKGSRGRIAGVAAASWVLATLVTSLVVWRAVAVFSDGSSADVLSAPQVSEKLSAATASPPASTSDTQSPTPTATTTPTMESETPTPSSGGTNASTSPTSPSSATTTRIPTKPTTSPTASTTPVVKTWTVTGGTVSVACAGQVISLVYASPQDGWRFETEKRGTDRIEIDFRRVGQGTELSVTCVNGVPDQTSQPTDGDH